VNIVRNELEEKRKFFSDLLALVDTSILNADSVCFTQLAFLLESGRQQFVCVVEIPCSFPKTAPSLSYLKVCLHVIRQGKII